MQKVEGSSPFSRFDKCPANRGVFVCPDRHKVPPSPRIISRQLVCKLGREGPVGPAHNVEPSACRRAHNRRRSSRRAGLIASEQLPAEALAEAGTD